MAKVDPNLTVRYSVLIQEKPKRFSLRDATRDHRVTIREAFDPEDYWERSHIEQLISDLQFINKIEVDYGWYEDPNKYFLIGERPAELDEIPLIDAAWDEYDKKEKEKRAKDRKLKAELKEKQKAEEIEQLKKLKEKYPDA